MAQPTRAEVIEAELQRIIPIVVVGLVVLLAGLFLLYLSTIATWMPFVIGVIVTIAGVGIAGYGGWQYMQLNNLPSYRVLCPYCEKPTTFLAPPTEDYSCEHCHRIVAVEAGQIVPPLVLVCRHCGAPQKVSPRAKMFICDNCNGQNDLKPARPGVAAAPAGAAEESVEYMTYDLVLVEAGHNTDEVLEILCTVLAAPRDHCRGILKDLPMVILVDLPRRKADSYRRMLREAGAIAEVHPTGQYRPPAKQGM
ncbi:MAG: hypothetical protein RMM08_03630 [Armatimonadota bacterium]|nr:hypothetical protein [bacterium]MDW8320433.1 hypothetical protein [Armatimonadota bacterium]